MSTESYGLLTCRHGGYLLLGPSIATSRFQGLFIAPQGKLTRVIESLQVEGELTEISTMLTCVQRRYAHIIEDIGYVRGVPAIAQRLNIRSNIELVLDGKRINDHREWGRSYTIHSEDNIVLIHFQKSNDPREEQGDTYEWWLAIASDELRALPQESWIKHAYTYDQERQSPPSDRYVYHALTLNAQEVVYAAGSDREEALKNATLAWQRRESAWNPHDQLALIHPKGEINHAYHAARHALCSLLAKGTNPTEDITLYAGLPWFHQMWSRDTAISLLALARIGHEHDARALAMRFIGLIGEDGLLPSIVNPAGDARSFDAVGWLFLSIHKLMDAHPKLFSQEEQDAIMSSLKSSIAAVKTNLLCDGLICTRSGMSWMDAQWKDDTREGARIEHQTLFLAMLKFLRVHARKSDPLERELASKVRYEFFKNNYLYDGNKDPTIRPNVFIAHHAYPELLTTTEWESCMDTVLPKLWLSWGGLSTIDIQHTYFTGHHTGENPQSYHRGDSWYWINNLAAIQLQFINAKKYALYIHKIQDASAKDILALGALGHHSELSSALSQTGQGCIAQAWSAAMFIEMVNASRTDKSL